MAKLGDVYEDLVLDAVLNQFDAATPVPLWFAVYLTDPIDDPTAEMTTTFDPAYSRQPLNSGRFAPASGGVTYYLDDVAFRVAYAEWPVIQYWAVMSDETGQTADDVFFVGRIGDQNPGVVILGGQARFRSGSWTVTLD